MTLLVLVILAVIWAAVLVPPYLQSRSDSRPGHSIDSFQRQLSVLERRAYPGAGGATIARPVVNRYAPVRSMSGRMTRAEAKKRRRDILFTLAGAAGVSFLMAVALGGGALWGLQLLCDATLAGYVYLLVQIQQHTVERDVKVRYLTQHPARRPAEPQLLLRRSGS